MIFVRVSEHDAAKIGNETRPAQTFAQALRLASFVFGAGIDDRHRIFGDQVDVDRANVEGRWQ
jgi:hypothetical protein